MIPIEVAMQHLYAEEDDRPQVERKLLSAIAMAENFMGRKIYANANDLAVAQVQAEKDIVNLSSLANDGLSKVKEQVNQAVIEQAKMAMFGVVITPAIEMAILLILGDLYAHRENSVVGGAMSLPMGARFALQSYRVMGV